MLNKFSINDLISATNTIFASKTKKKIPLNSSLRVELENTIIEKKLPMKKSEIAIKKKNNYLPQTLPNFTITLKEDAKSLIIDELYNLFKKKVKKNTLKIIIDQQLEVKNFLIKINFLTTNINNLENHYKDLKINLDNILKDKELLESNNKILLDKYKEAMHEKNTLQLNNNNLKGILATSTQNNKLLLNSSKDLHANLHTIVKDYKLLKIKLYDVELDNKKLNKNKQDLADNNKTIKINLEQLQNNKKLMNETNHKILINLDTTKLSLVKSIENNKTLEINNKKLLDKIELLKNRKPDDKFKVELNDELIENNKLLTDPINGLKNNKINEVNDSLPEEVHNKLKFYQDENVRLSSELVLTQKRHDILKANISKIETEKNNISNQIQELNDSLNNANNTNIVKTPFLTEIPQDAVDDLKEINNDEKKDLDEVINKIFSKL